MFHLESHNTKFLNSIFKYAEREHEGETDPIYNVLGVDPPSSSNPFTDIDTPFFIMERGPGGHAPYGDFNDGATEYFAHRKSASTQQIRRDYERSMELDSELFFNRLEELQERNVEDDTLVVYTSDHGEMLGEGGLLGHNGPMCPEVAYVPTVFIHPSLPEEYYSEAVFHHVDLLPTLCDALGVGGNILSSADGKSLLLGIPDAPRPCFWSARFFPDFLSLVSGKIKYEGVWDADSGRVYTENSRLERMLAFSGKLMKSPKRWYMRRNAIAGLRLYLSSDRIYGHPDFSDANARAILDELKRHQASAIESDLSSEARDHLRDLGYME